MTRVMLTGASGFVGSHALRHLLTETDHEIICPVSYRHKGTPDRVASALGLHCDRTGPDHEHCSGDSTWKSRVTIIHTDLRSPFTPGLLRSLGRVDQIWNVASESHVDRSIVEPAEFVRSNVEIALAMADNARELEPDLFLQMSTDEVYGPAEPGYSHIEWDVIRPSNPYSASKACQEAILYSYWRTYGLPLVITNTMNIVGETQDAEKFLPMVLRRVLAGETVPIHASLADSDNPVIGSRCWLHARNLADAWLWISDSDPVLAHADGFSDPLRLHIVGQELSNLELAEAVALAAHRIVGYDLVDFHGSRPGHDLRYSLDGTKIAELGWKAPVELMESLGALVRWTMAHPEWLI